MQKISDQADSRLIELHKFMLYKARLERKLEKVNNHIKKLRESTDDE
jgi:hypothetical protein